MNVNLNAITRTVLTITGAALAGPVGSVLGGFLGGLAGSALPFVTEVIQSLSTVATRESLTAVTQKTISRVTTADKQQLNHDLQTAFRDALIEGLHDIGGAVCFPQAWKHHPRQVPEEVFYPRCHPSKKERIAGDLLTSQVCDCLRALEQAVVQEEILPLEPPGEKLSSQAQTYLQAETPEALNIVFFDQNIRPVLARYQSLLNEVSDLEPHLRQHLLDRTLLHLGELLKQRTEAWRAYNRMSLESLRDLVNGVSEGQNALLARLDDLLANPQGVALTGWSESMADLLSATGKIEKKLDENFDALTERVISQHREVLARLDNLVAGTARIESKVDRMLRFLDNGGYVIDSQLTVPLRKPPAAGEAPFKGLEYFSQADSGLFYGRDRLIASLVERLGQCPFLAVIGASGSGKSSLVRAGLVPVLQGKRTLSQSPLLPVGSVDWPVHVITPTEQPFLALAASLAVQGATLSEVRALAEELRADPAALNLAARRVLSAGRAAKRLLLVVDQFEEVFTLCQDAEQRRAFVEALLQAGGPHGRGSVVLVIILRADFYAQCAQFEDLRQAVSTYQEYIGPMSREELRQAIEEPAQRNGWRF
ncbi:MAG TPA: ATP-binding protein, partial [Anaerolineaceae bacterium]|nr:ATP-binding protein [Anaerolineaceae bacterium]